LRSAVVRILSEVRTGTERNRTRNNRQSARYAVVTDNEDNKSSGTVKLNQILFLTLTFVLKKGKW